MWRDGSFQSVVLHCICVNQSLYPISAGLVMLTVKVLIYTDGDADKCDFPVMLMLSVWRAEREGTQKYNTVSCKREKVSNNRNLKMRLSRVI